MSLDTICTEELGDSMYKLIQKLYPICRSITGDGVRDTLNIIQEYVGGLQIHEVPSGTKVFDWTIPKEWNIKDAYVKDSKGERVIDFKRSNLHIMGYSIPVKERMNLEELKKHLYTIPERKDWIPYITSYYNENWGFCLSQNNYDNLEEDIYEVVIDSKLEDGSLTYGEYYIKGEIEEEVLITSYICHPSMCNDNLSGPSVIAHIANLLKSKELKYSYRFLFIPETIGSITWLSLNQHKVSNIKYGLVATCCGDNGISTYKKSRMGNSEIDIIAEKVLKDSNSEYKILDFFPTGSDERQFCSPGFNLPVGSLMRTVYGFNEYHTSADNLDFVNPKSLEDTLNKYMDIIFIIENNEIYINQNPKCEPQLGKRNLYRKLVCKSSSNLQRAMMWVLNFSDGKNSLLDIAIKAKYNFKEIRTAADLLLDVKLLKKRIK
ncbi:DUF4910 domain-containing protein [Clostridium sporogenes]|uniref:DUF4910 domain-containing protein n=1 Tax=Clostridium sporogenes TaxID=1509 RepID=UPI0013CC4553|nr:DUF4910 domain-containing protein [Clostridium sporogenes]NFQ00884.1 DUF4910 domain-containing protein [Clostridium sporogenes]NFQ40947.1 DUF4910 domain-containing protein [Clostridium sporogenes]